MRSGNGVVLYYRENDHKAQTREFRDERRLCCSEPIKKKRRKWSGAIALPKFPACLKN